MKELKQELDASLARQLVGSHIMSHFCTIDVESKLAGSFHDPRYVPFYYYLGKYIQPKTIAELGFRIGLFSGAFFKSCDTVEYLLAFQRKTDKYYSPRVGFKNIKRDYKGPVDFYYGNISDDEFISKLDTRSWDLVLINEEVNYDMHMNYLDYVWPRVSINGYIVMDNISSHDPAKRAFDSFCANRKLEPIRFNTRYGTGIVQKQLERTS